MGTSGVSLLSLYIEIQGKVRVLLNRTRALD